MFVPAFLRFWGGILLWGMDEGRGTGGIGV